MNSTLVSNACWTEDILIASESWGRAPGMGAEFHV